MEDRAYMERYRHCCNRRRYIEVIIIRIISFILAICEIALLCLAIRHIKFPWDFYDIELEYRDDEEKMNSELNKAKAEDKKGVRFLIGSGVCMFLSLFTLIIA